MGLFPDAIGTQNGLEFPQPLAEKYRPRLLSDFIGLERPRKVLSAFSQRPMSSAWVYVGNPGTGKTTMAQALCQAIRGEWHHIPSQRCDARAIDETVRMCWYCPSVAGSFHVVCVDEFDQMTPGAQLALLSKLDSTAAPPSTIWIFTGNSCDGMEPRFMSRCRVLDFSNYGMRAPLVLFLAKVWSIETNDNPEVPDFERIAKNSNNNVRAALMALEVELLSL
jgi:replication-associated recombination protein RarA